MKKIIDPNLLAKLDNRPVRVSKPTPQSKTNNTVDKLQQDNKRLSTVNNLLNNALDVKVVEVPFKVHVPVEKIIEKEVPVEKIVEKEVIKEVIKEVPVEKIVEKIVHKYIEVPVAIQQPKQNVTRQATEKVTIRNSRISTLKKLDDILKQ